MMGYIDADHVNTYDSYIRYGEHEAAWSVKDWKYSEMYTHFEHFELDSEPEFLMREGDRFELQLDFIKRECTAFYNGKQIGFVSSTLPREVYLVTTILSGGMELETTLIGEYNSGKHCEL